MSRTGTQLVNKKPKYKYSSAHNFDRPFSITDDARYCFLCNALIAFDLIRGRHLDCQRGFSNSDCLPDHSLLLRYFVHIIHSQCRNQKICISKTGIFIDKFGLKKWNFSQKIILIIG